MGDMAPADRVLLHARELLPEARPVKAQVSGLLQGAAAPPARAT